MAEKEKLVDVSGVISKMRQQRMKMVQTAVSIICWNNYDPICGGLYTIWGTRPMYRLLLIHFLHRSSTDLFMM